MAKKTLRECVTDAINLADNLYDLDTGAEPPVADVFKTNDKVTAVQLRQMAYKLRVQSAQFIEIAMFMEENPQAIEERRPVIWRIYASLYLDNAEDQMRIGLAHCLRKMREDASKPKAANEPYHDSVSSDSYVHASEPKSMELELEEVRKEVQEMMD